MKLRHSCLIVATHGTSFTLHGATGATLQRQHILCLPRKMTLMIDPRHIWNVIYIARSNRRHPPTSPNTVPAAKNGSHDWILSHNKKRHLHCVEQQESPSNVSIYCACHEKWLSWLILVTYEMPFTLHGATGVTLQHHQILPQPRKMALMIESCHIRNVIYIVRGSRSRPPTS